MKRPLVCALVFLAAGITAGRYAAQSAGVLLFFCGAAAVCALLLTRFRRAGVLAFFLFAVAGFNLFRWETSVADESLEALAARGESVTVQGVVRDAGLVTGADRQRLTLRLQAYEEAGGEVRRADQGMLLLVYLDGGERATCGEVVVLRGAPERLRQARNPGGFNEYMYYMARGVKYKMSASLVSVHGRALSPAVINHSLREKLLAVFDGALPPKEAGVLRSMIAGDKSALDAELAELYRQAGIYHIICISGLHISIIALCLDKLLERFLPVKASAALTLAFVAFYCAFTGNGVSTVRAAVMYGVIVGGKLLGRDRDLATSASFAAACLLLYQPLFLWDVGFQYSFAAVFGLAALTGPLEGLLHGLLARAPAARRIPGVGALGSAAASCLAATLATIPVVAYHFYYVQPVAFLANMLVLPTVTVTTAAGFLTGLLGLLGPVGGSAAVFTAGVPFVLLKAYEVLCRVFVSLPFSVVLTGRPPMPAVLGWYALLGLFAWAAGRAGKGGARRWRALYGGLALYAIAMFVHAAWPEPLRVAALDVGQGDCFVIKKDGAAFVIDGGGSAMREIGENTGVTVLKPYLDYAGISRIDGLFATHMDMDHVAGLIEILYEKPVGTLFISVEADRDDDLYRLLMEAAGARGVPVVTLGNGDNLQCGAYGFRCLYPAGGLQNPSGNNTSLVLKLEYGGVSFLFTGDLEAEGEAEMLERGLDVSADVLKLAHHGSKYSSTPEFLERVAPKAAIVSASRTNRYGHPSPEVIDALAAMNARVYSTAESGAVLMKTDGKRLWRENWGRED